MLVERQTHFNDLGQVEWTADDVEAAHGMANQLTRPCGSAQPTPEQAWQVRQPMSAAERLPLNRS